MRRLLLLLPLMVVGGCQTASRPYAPVENVRYTAIGQEPFWILTIGDDAIVLASSPDPGAQARRLRSYRYPRTLPRTVDGVRTWQSGDGTAVISVEATPGPCDGSGGVRYRDRVRVRLSGRELTGCGGPRLGRSG
jgi:uncharacterized membrane protein